jgi:2-iminobutanoate/2-iminopropanoate deaminase
MKTIVNANNAPAALGPYSQATIHNDVIYVSGQLPIDISTGKLLNGNISEQTRQVLTHISTMVEAARSNMDKMLKTTILLTDLANFAQVNQAYAKFFPNNPPARACYQVAALPLGAEIEIESICAV